MPDFVSELVTAYNDVLASGDFFRATTRWSRLTKSLKWTAVSAAGMTLFDNPNKFEESQYSGPVLVLNYENTAYGFPRFLENLNGPSIRTAFQIEGDRNHPNYRLKKPATFEKLEEPFWKLVDRGAIETY